MRIKALIEINMARPARLAGCGAGSGFKRTRFSMMNSRPLSSSMKRRSESRSLVGLRPNAGALSHG